jgi:hypothetical protein
VCVCVYACVRACGRVCAGFHSSNSMPLIIFQKFCHRTEKVFMSRRPIFFQSQMTGKLVGYLDTNVRDQGLEQTVVVPKSFFIIKYSFTGNKLSNAFMRTVDLRIVGNMTDSFNILVSCSDLPHHYSYCYLFLLLIRLEFWDMLRSCSCYV